MVRAGSCVALGPRFLSVWLGVAEPLPEQAPVLVEAGAVSRATGGEVKVLPLGQHAQGESGGVHSSSARPVSRGPFLLFLLYLILMLHSAAHRSLA